MTSEESLRQREIKRKFDMEIKLKRLRDEARAEKDAERIWNSFASGLKSRNRK